MKRRWPENIRSSEITPAETYFSRRRILRETLFLGAAAALAACSPEGASPSATPAQVPTEPPLDAPNTYEEITNINNFYEFTTSKERVAQVARDFVTSPWQVEVTGLVEQPGMYDLDALRRFEVEERIYRMRCVEGWSMVIPWNGFPLGKLLKAVTPLPAAKYVQFTTLLDPNQMPGQKTGYFTWPYEEGLRLDEAMHDLTLLVMGVYGKDLLPQNGAPVRLVVPWKYGFKSIKSIVKIDLTAEMPATFWNDLAPEEYGFYANVNPEVPHPRWSQATEYKIGTSGERFPTRFLNGYAPEVGELYKGMDLTKAY